MDQGPVRLGRGHGALRSAGTTHKGYHEDRGEELDADRDEPHASTGPVDKGVEAAVSHPRAERLDRHVGVDAGAADGGRSALGQVQWDGNGSDADGSCAEHRVSTYKVSRDGAESWLTSDDDLPANHLVVPPTIDVRGGFDDDADEGKEGNGVEAKPTTTPVCDLASKHAPCAKRYQRKEHRG